MVRILVRWALALGMATALVVGGYAAPASAHITPSPAECGGICFYVYPNYKGMSIRYYRPVRYQCYNLPVGWRNGSVASLANGTRLYSLTVFSNSNCVRNNGNEYVYRRGTGETFAPYIRSWMVWN